MDVLRTLDLLTFVFLEVGETAAVMVSAGRFLQIDECFCRHESGEVAFGVQIDRQLELMQVLRFDTHGYEPFFLARWTLFLIYGSGNHILEDRGRSDSRGSAGYAIGV